MSDVKWIKIYIDMFDKRKIKKIRRLPAGNDILLIWIMLLSMAGKCNDGGLIYITENVPFTEEDLADELGFETGTIRLAITAFTELDMISIDDAGFINVTGWEEYQNVEGMEKIREQNRERKRLQRGRQKQALLEDVSRDSHVTVTGCHAIEEDKDKDKETHSFIQGECDEDVRRKTLNGIGKGVVMLSDSQLADLLEKLSIDEFNRYVSIVAEEELKGHKYTKKTHYEAILQMATKDRKT